MIELTQQQCQALATTREAPPIVVDPQTQAAYVLLRREAYDRLKSVLDEDDAGAMAPLLADMDPEDWEDTSAYDDKP